jgi:hypothetical protein
MAVVAAAIVCEHEVRVCGAMIAAGRACAGMFTDEVFELLLQHARVLQHDKVAHLEGTMIAADGAADSDEDRLGGGGKGEWDGDVGHCFPG